MGTDNQPVPCFRPAGEEAKDLRRVYFDVESFSALVKGYFKGKRPS